MFSLGFCCQGNHFGLFTFIIAISLNSELQIFLTEPKASEKNSGEAQRYYDKYYRKQKFKRWIFKFLLAQYHLNFIFEITNKWIQLVCTKPQKRVHGDIFTMLLSTVLILLLELLVLTLKVIRSFPISSLSSEKCRFDFLILLHKYTVIQTFNFGFLI